MSFKIIADYHTHTSIGKVAALRNTALEINRSHRNMDTETIKKLKNMGVKFSLGSDAHKSEDVGYFGKAYNIAALAGLTDDDIVMLMEVHIEQ